MEYTIKVWRQKDSRSKGGFEKYKVKDVDNDASFLEMLDILNEQLIEQGIEPVAFDHDCREGICGTCSLYINGRAHGPNTAVTVCQLFMRDFKEGSTITIEPWRAKPFPILKDLIVDRSAFERIQQAGGFITVNTGQAPDAHSVTVPKHNADSAFDAAACIGCGSCVAACKNASAMLFISAKVAHLAYLPQGRLEAERRVKAMVEQADKEGFGSCTNTYACEVECPKEISIVHIAKLNREYIKSSFAADKKKTS